MKTSDLHPAINFQNKFYSDAVKQTLGRPSKHGWVWNDKNRVYHPVMTESESIPELSMCKCNTG